MDIRADLHIHTVLSPCGDLEMSPENILHFAQIQGLNMIGITDHNSTRQAPIIRDYGKTKGIFVLTGAEICSKEEVHALTFFETDEQLTIFQHYLDVHLPDIPNEPEEKLVSSHSRVKGLLSQPVSVIPIWTVLLWEM